MRFPPRFHLFRYATGYRASIIPDPRTEVNEIPSINYSIAKPINIPKMTAAEPKNEFDKQYFMIYYSAERKEPRMIAAHARSNGHALVTDNMEDFMDIEGLVPENRHKPGDLKMS